MKLKLLKGTVKNLCDSISSPPFSSISLTREKLPAKGIWFIDLKDGSTRNDKDKPVSLKFTKSYHLWFLKEISHAKIPLDKVDKAELAMHFDLRNKKDQAWCSCTIEVDGKKFYHEVHYNVFWFLN